MELHYCYWCIGASKSGLRRSTVRNAWDEAPVSIGPYAHQMHIGWVHGMDEKILTCRNMIGCSKSCGSESLFGPKRLGQNMGSTFTYLSCVGHEWQIDAIQGAHITCVGRSTGWIFGSCASCSLAEEADFFPDKGSSSYQIIQL